MGTPGKAQNTGQREDEHTAQRPESGTPSWDSLHPPSKARDPSLHVSFCTEMRGHVRRHLRTAEMSFLPSQLRRTHKASSLEKEKTQSRTTAPQLSYPAGCPHVLLPATLTKCTRPLHTTHCILTSSHLFLFTCVLDETTEA